MRVLIVSDIHANFVALDAVLQHAGAFDYIWCLGDVVGYGPQPNECIARLREFNLVCLAGNHDLGVAGKVGLWDFSDTAREVLFWTRHWLTTENLEWLTTLSNEAQVIEGITLVHASLRDPVWEYIVDREIARDNLKLLTTTVGFNGHTHLPVIFRKPWEGLWIVEEPLPINKPLALGRDPMLINPGSVGQPRDEDPRAAYALLDLETMTLTHQRVLYDVSLTQKLMKQAKLPEKLIRRLRFGQ